MNEWMTFVKDELRKIISQYKKLVYNKVQAMDTGCAEVGRR